MSVTFKSENIQKYRELADSIKSGIKVTGASGKEEESHSAYYNNLPEGVSKKNVEELSKYNSKFIAASHIAMGELAADIFNTNKSINQANFEIGFFGKGDTIESTIDRTKTYQNHLATNEDDKEVTKHLVIKSTINTVSGKGYGVKAIKESMSQEFADMFKK